ncbi:MAG: AAA family ATPase [Caldilineaceae bacterium]|nr:AAA family ATPase [Caldilineaceae bacterium]
MLTNMTIRNFKRFEEVDIPLGTSVVFIGPNNSGKTAALQALALWDGGLRRWQERYQGKEAPGQRPGVTINRRDLIAIPVPRANLLWRDLRTRQGTKINGKPGTQNVRIDIVVDGITDGEPWSCGLEFDYANEESFYCRPLRTGKGVKPGERMPVPAHALQTHVAYLPPMSGLAAVEPKWEQGRVNVLIGEGQTAQVLRNLCHNLAQSQPDDWRKVQLHIDQLFGAKLDKPDYIAERGEITMSYSESAGVSLALSASGRGLQQTLLLLAYLYTNPSAVLLLDEPDAHLEILRQRQIYRLLSEIAAEVDSQIIAASHSEVILNEAAAKDIVVAFVGEPHRIDDRSARTQVAKALKQIGFEDYYQAAQTGWVLYLEGSTDLSCLQAFAEKLSHPAAEHLARPFVHYVGNQPLAARNHFHGLREAKSDLVGVGIYDRDVSTLESSPYLREIRWQRREIENYLPIPEVLRRYAQSSTDEDAARPGTLFSAAEEDRRLSIMNAVINDLVPPIALRNPADSYWEDVKASELLDRVFEEYFGQLQLANLIRKTAYHRLAALARAEELNSEVINVLDQIEEVAKQAKTVNDR